MDPNQNRFNGQMPYWSEFFNQEMSDDEWLRQNDIDMDVIRSQPPLIIRDNTVDQATTGGELVRVEEQGQARRDTTMATFPEEEEGNLDQDDQDTEPEPAKAKKPKGKSIKTDPAYRDQKANHKKLFWKQLDRLRNFYNRILGEVDEDLDESPLREVMEAAMKEREIETEDIDFVWGRVKGLISQHYEMDMSNARRKGKPGKKAASKK